MNTMRFCLTPSTALIVGLSLAACEKRTEPSRETDRAPYQEPVREARPSTDTTPADRTTTDKTTADRGTTGTDPARPAPAATAQNASAVSSITEARCEREARCNNIGNGKKFESRDECVTKTRADWRDDLNARECPNGVVSSQLASCVSQIKDENCSNVVEKLETVLACRTADLCKRG